MLRILLKAVELRARSLVGRVWSDEMLDEVWQVCRRHDSWAFRYVLAYRASVIRGEPDARFQAVWQQVARECPNWPGLRPERSSPSLAQQLDGACKQFIGDEFNDMLNDEL